MTDQLSRSPRSVQIADHLWELLSRMSAEMGVEVDGLVNQALFALARQNGYLQPAGAGIEAPPAASSPLPASSAGPPPAPFASPPPAPPSAGASAAFSPDDSSAPFVSATPPDPGAPFAPARSFAARPAEEPTPAQGLSAPQDRFLQGAEELERLVGLDTPPGARASRSHDPFEPTPEPSTGPTLTLFADGREVDRVTHSRFLIGRGKHCDLIINSGKVSREHAAIIREGGHFFIEDLRSSNGTWFDKQRITRRQVEDGDEYLICSEKLICRLSDGRP